MTTDIIIGTDCVGNPLTVWHAFLRAARYDAGRRTCELRHAELAVRSLSPGVGVRGKARWGEVRYRVTVYLLPNGDSTRLLLVGTVDLRSMPARAAALRYSRRLATRDLREVVAATVAELGRDAALERSA